jgi:hypothetical protein
VRDHGSGDASATRRRRRARPRRGRDALIDAGCQRVRCFCGGCRAPCRPARLCRGSTHGRAGRRGAGGGATLTCMCVFRPLRGACAWSVPPGTHGRVRGTHTPRRRVRGDMRGPSRMHLPVRVPAACVRAGLLQRAGPWCFDGWCLNCRPPGRILLQRGWALALAGRVMQPPEKHRVDTDPARRRGEAVGVVHTVSTAFVFPYMSCCKFFVCVHHLRVYACVHGCVCT